MPTRAVAVASPADQSVPSDIRRRDLSGDQHRAVSGWAPLGERLKAKAPYGRCNTMTLIAALPCDQVDAPWLIDAPIDGDGFQRYVENVLLPTLHADDVVVPDNRASGRRKVIRWATGSVGARMIFLPKHSLELNPSSISPR